MKQSAQTTIHVSVEDQCLRVLRDGKLLHMFPVSTSRYGLGFKQGSRKTPLGRFRIAQKIGGDQPMGTVFKSRKPVRMSVNLPPDADLVVSRILWLDGLGLRNANSRARFIYLHGTNHEDAIGRPASHGCVRMRNADVVQLFDLVAVGTPVVIARGRWKTGPKSKGKKALRPWGYPPK